MVDYSKVVHGIDNIEKILIYNTKKSSRDPSFFYLAQPKSGTFENSLIVFSHDGVKIITSELEKQPALETGNQVIVYHDLWEMQKLIRDAVGSSKRIGVNFTSLTVEGLENLKQTLPTKELVDVSAKLMNARMIKSPDEVKYIKEANRISSEAFESTILKIKEGIKETELSAELTYEMMKHGASTTAFESIVAFGENSAIPHHHPTERKLKRGDFVLMDFGSVYKLYCSDVTRTLLYGRASEEQQDMYETVVHVQSESVRAIRDGVEGRKVHSLARAIIDSSKYAGMFIHGLGHGVGLEVHDHPALSQNSDVILRRGMVVTVEPGIYKPGFGGVRIEDDILVKEDGAESLTSAFKELIEI